MDSTGLRLVIRWDTAAREDGFEFAIVPGPEVVQRVFRLTGMDDASCTLAEPPTPTSPARQKAAADRGRATVSRMTGTLLRVEAVPGRGRRAGRAPRGSARPPPDRGELSGRLPRSPARRRRPAHDRARRERRPARRRRRRLATCACCSRAAGRRLHVEVDERRPRRAGRPRAAAGRPDRRRRDRASPRRAAGEPLGRAPARRAHGGLVRSTARRITPVASRSGAVAAKRLEVEIDGRTLSLSNLDKVLYPAGGVHQGPRHRLLHARRAGAAAAPARPAADAQALPERRRRRRTSTRSSARRTAPDWVRDRRRSEPRATAARSTSAWPTTCRRSCGWPTSPTSSCTPRWRWRTTTTRPTVIAFDLDPGPPATIVECAEVALELRDVFDHLGLRGVPEDLGLQGHAGLRAAQHAGATYDETQAVRARRSPSCSSAAGRSSSSRR